MIGKIASGMLTLITALLISAVFMVPVLLIMEWIGTSLTAWAVYLIVFVIVIVEMKPLIKTPMKEMWA